MPLAESNDPGNVGRVSERPARPGFPLVVQRDLDRKRPASIALSASVNPAFWNDRKQPRWDGWYDRTGCFRLWPRRVAFIDKPLIEILRVVFQCSTPVRR